MGVTDGGRNACVSTDGGATFSVADLGRDVDSALLFAGGRFTAWGGGQLVTSDDGLTWSSRPVSPAGLAIGPVAASPEGSFVAVRGGWNTWYENQEAYRSTDGVSWEPVAGFPGGHPIVDAAFGYVAPSADCPRP